MNGVRPADHHKFLRVQAFDLEPQAAVGGCIRRIGAFRDDPLEGHGLYTMEEMQTLYAAMELMARKHGLLPPERGEDVAG
jgi:hypothetical protein